jgi:antitoxin component of RelBE/YafQ-DinJ toxin-antitoxin module
MLDEKPDQEMSFRKAVDTLAKKLIEEKKIPFAKLINQHFSIPADRIAKFLKILKTDL